MKMKTLVAACAMAFAGQAFALAPNTVPDVQLYMSGSSALQNAIGQVLLQSAGGSWGALQQSAPASIPPISCMPGMSAMADESLFIAGPPTDDAATRTGADSNPNSTMAESSSLRSDLSMTTK